MGVEIKIGDKVAGAATYTVTEESVPVAGGDATGSVGGITLEGAVAQGGISALDSINDVTLTDSERGDTLGTIKNMSRNRTSGDWRIDSDSRLSEFMIEIQVQPYSGTLEGAFLYYASLANITTDVIVDDELKARPVDFIGFSGNLWSRMKEMAIGVGADLNLISGVIVLRPLRAFVAVEGRDTESSFTLDKDGLALKQEVIWYNTAHRASSIVYPPGGWNNEVRVYSVNAGEDAEHNIEVESSITSIQAPTMVTDVSPTYSATSVYTIVGDDNLPIQPAQWAAYGGKVSVEIAPDTRSLIVKMTGASGMVQIDGNPMKIFRLALSAGSTDSTYSTLRIVGNAVHMNQRSIIINTGVEPWRTGQEFAPTIDNEFLNTIDSAFSAGVRGARRHAGRTFTLDSSVVGINGVGDPGEAKYPTYEFSRLKWEGNTYAQVTAELAGMTYAEVREMLYEEVNAGGVRFQVFGNAPGARVWDEESRHWYRVRTANTSWSGTQIGCDDDTLWSDFQLAVSGMTYAEVNEVMSGKTYLEATLAGIPDV